MENMKNLTLINFLGKHVKSDRLVKKIADSIEAEGDKHIIYRILAPTDVYNSGIGHRWKVLDENELTKLTPLEREIYLREEKRNNVIRDLIDAYIEDERYGDFEEDLEQYIQDHIGDTDYNDPTNKKIEWRLYDIFGTGKYEAAGRWKLFEGEKYKQALEIARQKSLERELKATT